MFAYIKGTVTEIGTDEIIVETGGIGFSVFTSSQDSARLTKNQQATIYTHLNVREDDMSLFGFLTKEERSVFRMLINISGVGPKSALSILSCLSVDELRMAVLSDDYKAIAKANGIGPKTAQRLVIELRDKFHLEDVLGEYDEAFSSNIMHRKDIVSVDSNGIEQSWIFQQWKPLRAIKKDSGQRIHDRRTIIKGCIKAYYLDIGEKDGTNHSSGYYSGR